MNGSVAVGKCLPRHTISHYTMTYPSETLGKCCSYAPLTFGQVSLYNECLAGYFSRVTTFHSIMYSKA